MRSCSLQIFGLIGACFMMAEDRAGAQFLPPPEVESCLQSAFVTEPFSLQAPEGCRERLTQFVSAHWREIMRQWEGVAPTDDRKWVLFSAAEELDPERYIAFLEDVRELRQSDRINQQMFEVVVLMPGQRKEAFLALNHQNPRVRDYLASIRAMTSEKLQPTLDNISSGRRKAIWMEEYQKADRSVAPLLLSSQARAEDRAAIASVPQVAPTNTPLPGNTEKPDTSTATGRGARIWPLIIGIVVLLGGAAALRRRFP